MNIPDPLHPALVHFPIVLLLVGAVIAITAFAMRRVWLSRLTAAVLVLAAAGTLAAAWSGEEDEDAAEHAGAAAEQVFEEHEEWGERTRNSAIVAALVAGLAALSIKSLPRFSRGAAALTVVVALAASWCVIQAGHYGGQLVYQHGVGVKHNTSGIRVAPTHKARHHDD